MNLKKEAIYKLYLFEYPDYTLCRNYKNWFAVN